MTIIIKKTLKKKNNVIFLIFSLKTYIVGTRKNHLAEAVLMRPNNHCFGSEIKKLGIPLQTPVFPNIK